MLTKTLFQASRVVCIGSTHDPDRSRSPTVHRLTEEEASSEQTFYPFMIQAETVIFQRHVRSGVQQVGGVAPSLSKPLFKTVILAGSQRADGGLTPPDDQRRGQQQHRLRVQRKFSAHWSWPAKARARGQTCPQPLDRSNHAATVNVQRESTTSSTRRTDPPGNGPAAAPVGPSAQHRRGRDHPRIGRHGTCHAERTRPSRRRPRRREPFRSRPGAPRGSISGELRIAACRQPAIVCAVRWASWSGGGT